MFLLGWSAGMHWSQCSACDSKHASRGFCHRKVSFWYVAYEITFNDSCNCVFMILPVFMSLEVSLSLPMNQFFSARYVKQNLALVAVDEAHCITDW